MATYSAHAPRTLPLVTGPSDWHGLLKMAPATLELVSPAHAAHQGWELLSNAANSRRFQSVLSSLQAHLRDGGVPVVVDESRGAPDLVSPADLSRAQRRWVGQVALELYFTQLFRSEVAVVDLWPSHFGVDRSGDAVWSPRPFYLRWDDEFRDGLRNFYSGFFLGRSTQLQTGIEQLGLAGSSEPLLEHLGEGNQRSVRFDRNKLESTLTAMSARRTGVESSLHRNFIAFGLYVTSLHELLSSLDLAFDVRSAFMRSRPRP